MDVYNHGYYFWTGCDHCTLAWGVALLLQLLSGFDTLPALQLISDYITLWATGVCCLPLGLEEPVILPALEAVVIPHRPLPLTLPGVKAGGAVGVEGLAVLPSIVSRGEGVEEAPLDAPVAGFLPCQGRLAPGILCGGCSSNLTRKLKMG